MSLYTPPPGSGASSGGSGLSEVAISVSSPMTVQGSPITLLSEDPTIILGVSEALFSGNNASVIQIKPNGDRYYYIPELDTDAARGTTLHNAQAAHSIGDTFVLGPGNFLSQNTGNYSFTGCTLIGHGMYTTTLQHQGGVQGHTLTIVSGSVHNLGIITSSPSITRRGLYIHGGSHAYNIYCSGRADVDSHSLIQVGDVQTVLQPQSTIQGCRLINGTMRTSRFQNPLIKDTYVLSVRSPALVMGNSCVVNSYNNYYATSGIGDGAVGIDVGATIRNVDAIGCTLNSYNDVIINTSGRSCVNTKNASENYSFYNATIINTVYTGVACTTNSNIRLIDCYVSGAMDGIVRTTGNIFSYGTISNTAQGIIDYGTFSHTSMPAANATTNGYLTSGDWNTFNSVNTGISYGHMNLLDAQHVVFNTGNIPSGSYSTLFTVPATRKYIFHQCRVYGPGLTDGIAFRVNNSYYGESTDVGYIEGDLLESRFIHVFNPNDVVSIRGVQTVSPFYGGATGVNMSAHILSVPTGINIRTVTLQFGSGTTPLYTCPAGKVAMLSVQEDNDDYCLRLVNHANISRTVNVHYVPSGGAPSGENFYQSIVVLPSGSGMVSTAKLGGALTAGMTVTAQLSTSGLISSHITVLEYNA